MPILPRKALPPPLNPRRVMSRNELCWCESGKKWKVCHRDRHLQKAHNYFIAKSAHEKAFEVGECSHPEAPVGCVGRTIKSHTLQKGAALAAIAEDQHVISGGPPATERLHQNGGKIIPRRTGVNKASTFPGFCSSHDTSLFLPIESGSLPLDRYTAFLLSYRAMSYELHAKKSAIHGIESARLSDAGKSFEEQAEVQQDIHAFLTGMRWGVEDLRRWKSQLDRIFKTKDTSAAGLLAVEFENVLPFVAAFALQPEWDFAGKKLQDWLAETPAEASLTVTVTAGKSIAVFTWFDGPGGVGERLAHSFSAIAEGDRPTALLRFVLAFSENVHMRPSWWAALTPAERADALALVTVGMPFEAAPPALALVGAGPLQLPVTGSRVLSL